MEYIKHINFFICKIYSVINMVSLYYHFTKDGNYIRTPTYCFDKII